MFKGKNKMKTSLLDILLTQAKFVQDSGFTVNIDNSLPTVAMIDEHGETQVFLQGAEAEDFLSEVERMYEEVMVIDHETVTFSVAKPYIESLD